MKALLIADNPRAIDNISQILETAGYDVIIYKWLLKALDNIEEISPHLIVVSAKDYPRHWKTLAQYSQTLFASYKPQVILFAEGGLEEEERSKAQALKVRGIFESVDVCGLEKLREILTKETDIYAGKLLSEEGIPTVGNLLMDEEKTQTPQEKEDSKQKIETDELLERAKQLLEEQKQPSDDCDERETDAPETNEYDGVHKNEPSTGDMLLSEIACSFMFENPQTGTLVTGYACNFDGKTFSFAADIPDFVKNLSEGAEIENGSLKTAETIRCIRTIVKKNQENLVLELA